MRYSEVNRKISESLRDMSAKELLTLSNVLVSIENLGSFVEILREVVIHPEEVKDQALINIYNRIKTETYKK
jgi:hypothetical protein